MFSKAEEVSYLFRGLKLGFDIQDPERRAFNLCPSTQLWEPRGRHTSVLRIPVELWMSVSNPKPLVKCRGQQEM